MDGERDHLPGEQRLPPSDTSVPSRAVDRAFAALIPVHTAPGAIQSDALTLRIFRDMAGFDHGGLLEIFLRVRYRDGYRRETEREFQGPPKELPITPRR